MKVTVKLIQGEIRVRSGKRARPTYSSMYIEDVVYHAISSVLWDGDWVRLVPIDSRVQQVSYRKDLVFAVVEEKENVDE